MLAAANKLIRTLVLTHTRAGLDAAPVRRPVFLKASYIYSIKSGENPYLFVIYRQSLKTRLEINSLMQRICHAFSF
jgi:hypothetical protein